MAPDVTGVVALHPYVVRVVFADGEVRDVDVEGLLDTPVFAPVRDHGFFSDVAIDEQTGTFSWPNGADIDPDVVYGLQVSAIEPAAGITTVTHREDGPAASRPSDGDRRARSS